MPSRLKLVILLILAIIGIGLAVMGVYYILKKCTDQMNSDSEVKDGYEDVEK